MATLTHRPTGSWTLRNAVRLALSGSISAVVGSAALALPTGGTVVGGATNATIAATANTTTVTSKQPQVVITWNGFDTTSAETVNFTYPTNRPANWLVLNRVIAGGQTSFDGTLTADPGGHIWILNPNGVLFGHNASVSAAGLFVAAMDYSITDAQALADLGNGTSIPLTASADGKAVTTLSSTGGGAGISASSYLTIAAPAISSSATISPVAATIGTVTLSSGTAAVISFNNGLVNYALDKTGATTGTSATDGVTVGANGAIQNAQVVILEANVAHGLAGNAINVAGTITAKTAVNDGGMISLVGYNGSTNDAISLGGTVNAAGSGGSPAGGSITVTGQGPVTGKVNAGTGSVTVSGDTIGTGTSNANRFGTTASSVTATANGAAYLLNTGDESLNATAGTVDAKSTGAITSGQVDSANVTLTASTGIGTTGAVALLQAPTPATFSVTNTTSGTIDLDFQAGATNLQAGSISQATGGTVILQNTQGNLDVSTWAQGAGANAQTITGAAVVDLRAANTLTVNSTSPEQLSDSTTQLLLTAGQALATAGGGTATNPTLTINGALTNLGVTINQSLGAGGKLTVVDNNATSLAAALKTTGGDEIDVTTTGGLTGSANAGTGTVQVIDAASVGTDATHRFATTAATVDVTTTGGNVFIANTGDEAFTATITGATGASAINATSTGAITGSADAGTGSVTLSGTQIGTDAAQLADRFSTGAAGTVHAMTSGGGNQFLYSTATTEALTASVTNPAVSSVIDAVATGGLTGSAAAGTGTVTLNAATLGGGTAGADGGSTGRFLTTAGTVNTTTSNPTGAQYLSSTGNEALTAVITAGANSSVIDAKSLGSITGSADSGTGTVVLNATSIGTGTSGRFATNAAQNVFTTTSGGGSQYLSNTAANVDLDANVNGPLGTSVIDATTSGNLTGVARAGTGTVALNAATIGISAANPFDTTASTVSATAAGSNVYLANTGSEALTASGALVDATTTGAITSGTIDSPSVTLQANTGIGTVTQVGAAAGAGGTAVVMLQPLTTLAVNNLVSGAINLDFRGGVPSLSAGEVQGISGGTVVLQNSNGNLDASGWAAGTINGALVLDLRASGTLTVPGTDPNTLSNAATGAGSALYLYGGQGIVTNPATTPTTITLSNANSLATLGAYQGSASGLTVDATFPGSIAVALGTGGNGPIVVNAAAGLTGSANAGTGTVTLNATSIGTGTGGRFTTTAGTVNATTTTGDQYLASNGDEVLNALINTSTAASVIDATSTGAISGGNANAGTGTVNLSAVAIGTGPSTSPTYFFTTAGTVNATTTTGDQYLFNSGDEVLTATITTPTANSNLFALDIGTITGSADAGTGNVVVRAQNSVGSGTGNRFATTAATVTAESVNGNIYLSNTQGENLSAVVDNPTAATVIDALSGGVLTGSANAGSGTVNLGAVSIGGGTAGANGSATGRFATTASAVNTTTTGSEYLANTGSVALDLGVTTVNAANVIDATSTGAITGGASVVSGTVNLSAVSIGTGTGAGRFATHAATVNTTTSTGDQYLINSSGEALTAAITSPTAASVIDAVASTGTMTGSAADGTGTVTLNATQIGGGTGNRFATTAAMVNTTTTTGNQYLASNGDEALAATISTPSAASVIDATGTGAITGSANDGAGTVTLNAVSIGTSAASLFSTTAGTVNTTTSTGSQFLSNPGAEALTATITAPTAASVIDANANGALTGSASAGAGTVELSAVSIGTGTGGRFATTAAAVDASTTTGNQFLSSTVDEALTAAIAAPTGASLIDATGTGAITGSANAGTGTVTLHAVSLGANAGSALATTAGTVNATTSSGDQFLSNTGDEVLTAVISAPTAASVISAASTGGITGSANDGAGQVALNGTSIGGGTGARFATTAGTVNATSAGAVFLSNAGDEALNASGATVDATSGGALTGSASAGSVTLSAVSIGTGTGGRFATTANTVHTTTTTGNQYLSNTGDEALTATITTATAASVIDASSSGALTGSAHAGAGTVTVHGASAIGTGTGGRFSTDAATVNATSSGAVFLASTTAGSEALTASGSTVDATATGGLTGSATGPGGVTLSAASIGTDVAGTITRFSTTTGALTATATNGGAYLANTGDATLTATGGVVDATLTGAITGGTATADAVTLSATSIGTSTTAYNTTFQTSGTATAVTATATTGGVYLAHTGDEVLVANGTTVVAGSSGAMVAGTSNAARVQGTAGDVTLTAGTNLTAAAVESSGTATLNAATAILPSGNPGIAGTALNVAAPSVTLNAPMIGSAPSGANTEATFLGIATNNLTVNQASATNIFAVVGSLNPGTPLSVVAPQALGASFPEVQWPGAPSSLTFDESAGLTSIGNVSPGSGSLVSQEGSREAVLPNTSTGNTSISLFELVDPRLCLPSDQQEEGGGCGGKGKSASVTPAPAADPVVAKATDRRRDAGGAGGGH